MASMLPPSAFADEASDELTQETIDRVYDEVLTGEITSTEDVLRVAPSTNTVITSYPSGTNVDWEPLDAIPIAGFGSLALIYYGSDVYDVGIDVNPSAVAAANITW